SPAHLALARTVSQESIVLLKNAGAALPLDRFRLAAVAVVGPLADIANIGDLGSSFVAATASVSPLAGMRAGAGGVAVNQVPAAQLPLSPEEATAVAAADAAVVVVGLDYRDEGEGLITHGDRDGLVLPRDQDALV